MGRRPPLVELRRRPCLASSEVASPTSAPLAALPRACIKGLKNMLRVCGPPTCRTVTRPERLDAQLACPRSALLVAGVGLTACAAP